MGKRALFAMASVLALGCARSHAEPSVAPSSALWSLVYVMGSEGTLERRDDTTLDWSAACAGTCGQYVPSSGTYRLRGADATSAAFSLPAPQLGRVMLRFDDDGRVWTHHMSGMPRQPFAPLVLFLQVR
jgi:hypothetical protein